MSTAVGFVGGRLTQARYARGVSACDFAEMTGVKKQSISKYENSKQSPKNSTVTKFASVLRFPTEFFFRPFPSDEDTRPVFWRSKLSAQKMALDRARVRMDWQKEIIDYLNNFFDYPPTDLPDFDLPDSILDINSDDIQWFSIVL